MISRAIVLLGLLAAAAPALAQKPPEIGVLVWDSNTFVEAFRRGLREHGYEEGKNIVVEWRSAERERKLAARHAAEFAKRGVAAIVVQGSPAAQAVRDATQTIPVVLGGIADPVALGLVKSFGQTGNNITGVTMNIIESAGKRLEVLREALPALKRVAFLGSSLSPNTKAFLADTRRVAQRLGVQVQEVLIAGPDDLDRAFAEIAKEKAQAVIVQGTLIPHRVAITQRAAQLRLASISEFALFPQAGGLMSYGPDQTAVYRQAAAYVAKILKGAKPADLPIELPSHLKLVVNRQTAKALGISIPQTVLVRADEVIQ